MLSDDHLIVETRRLNGTNQRLPVLLLLAHLPQPAKTSQITEKGVEIGFRKIREWNVSAILRAAAESNHVAQKPDGWSLLEPGFDSLKAAGLDIHAKRGTKPSDSILPRELFAGTRGYLVKVVAQVNGSYDHGFYDCCAVMCRRLIETLIIEAYEAEGRANDIKGADNNFLMLNGLLVVLSNDSKIHLGRNAKRGLEGLKELGDKSAHNRRFNARQSDIDTVRSDLRTAAEELLHVAKLAN